MAMDLREGVIKFTTGCWLGLMLLCLPALQAHAQTPPQAPPLQLQGVPLQLNGQPSGAEINVYVWRDRPATLYFVPSAAFAAPLQCTIVAVNFPVNVTLKKPGDAGPANQELTIDLAANTPAPVTLAVEDLPPGDLSSGALLVTSKGNNPMSWKVNLKAPVGTMVVDPPTVSLAIMKPIFGSQSQLITVAVHEKTGRVGLDGISARPGPVVKAPAEGFDLGRNVDFLFNGQEAPELNKWPPIQSSGPNRSISSNNGLATVGLRVKNLGAGEYNATVQFQSINSINDDAKLVLNLQVRHHWLWALLVLILAVVLSFAATKVVSSRRQRLLFMQRIEKLKPAWLNDEPKLLPVVWAQAILRQSQDLSKRFWLTGEDQIEARVTQVEGMMKVLDRIRVLRGDIQTSPLRKYVKYRAIAKLNGIVSSMGNGFVDDAVVKDLDDTLTNLRQWLDENAGAKYYWRDFRTDIVRLLSDIEPTFFPELYQPLTAATAIDLPPDMISIEEQYAKMKLLWERRNAPPPEVARLKAEAIAKAKEEIFRQADQEAWDRLNSDKLAIKMPDVDDINVLMAYTPVPFSIETTDESLAETYLFRHGLQFEWTFAVTLGKTDGKQRESKKQRTMKLTPMTEEPQVIQYFPEAGQVTVSVEISWRGAPGKSIKIAGATPRPISDCNDFKIFRGLEKVEVISFATAAAAAILTGITTFYLKNSGFGTTSDYLTLFAWGFGIDQSKTFLQNLQANSK